MAEEHTGSETIGAAGEKSRMTLFRDDRAEDLGAILLAVLVIATVVVIVTFFRSAAPPVQSTPVAAPAPATAPAAAPAATPGRP
jgi:hypothetical protein